VFSMGEGSRHEVIGREWVLGTRGGWYYRRIDICSSLLCSVSFSLLTFGSNVWIVTIVIL